MSIDRHLVWLRADLRVTDNTALAAACSQRNTEVACVYAITPGQWRQHDVAGVKIDFELRSLRALSKDLDQLNIPLLIIEADDFSALPKMLGELCQQHGITSVHCNSQYEVNELKRDNHVASQLTELGITFIKHHDQCIVPPGQVLTADNRFYSVFTPFKRNWLTRPEVQSPMVCTRPEKRKSRFVETNPLPTAVKGFVPHIAEKTALEWWPAGEEAALTRLAEFVENGIRFYDEHRNFPERTHDDGVSRISPYLAVGAISSRQCLNAAINYRRHHGDNKGVDQWISELAWRDFYKHVMIGWPHVCKHRPFKLETSHIPWRHDENDFKRWCEGKTGFPLVDAAMRQLQQTGWMHNRLRMVVAMFLTKDLFIDWRWGERFFMQHLIDGDLSANNGGWQWSASTGNDAAPYFRIFNPILQSERFDPNGHFIREYVKELRDIKDKSIHQPKPSLFSTYPEPMVDRRIVKDRVLGHFKNLKSLTQVDPQ